MFTSGSGTGTEEGAVVFHSLQDYTHSSSLHHVSGLKLSLRTIILTMILLWQAVVLAEVIPVLFQPHRDGNEGLWSPSMSFNQDAHIWFIYVTTE